MKLFRYFVPSGFDIVVCAKDIDSAATIIWDYLLENANTKYMSIYDVRNSTHRYKPKYTIICGSNEPCSLERYLQ